MAQIGLNYRLTVANTLRQQTRTLYEGVLGANVKSLRPDIEIFHVCQQFRDRCVLC
jgi:hypothetical protein